MNLNYFFKATILIAFVVLFSCTEAKKENKYESIQKTEKWKIRDNTERIEDMYFNSNSIDSLTLSKVLFIIDNTRDFDTLCLSKSWCIKNYNLVFSDLIDRLIDTAEIGINPHVDLQITDRELPVLISTGSKPGIIIIEDIFSIAGRASWILNDMTGENFAVVRKNTTFNQLKEFQESWNEWLKKIEKK